MSKSQHLTGRKFRTKEEIEGKSPDLTTGLSHSRIAAEGKLMLLGDAAHQKQVRGCQPPAAITKRFEVISILGKYYKGK